MQESVQEAAKVIQTFPFNGRDWVFIFLNCPLFALLGSIGHICRLTHNLTTLDGTRNTTIYQRAKEHGFTHLVMELIEVFLNRIDWIFSRLFIGYVSGILVGLYFLSEALTRPALAKIYGLCILIGAIAPYAWDGKEKVIERYVALAVERYCIGILKQKPENNTKNQTGDGSERKEGK